MIKMILVGFGIILAFLSAIAAVVAFVWAIADPVDDCPPWIKWPVRIVATIGMAYMLGWATLHK